MNDLSLQGRLRQIQLVGVASGAGAPDPGCEAAADALRATQLTARLRAQGFRARWAPVIRPAAAYRANSLQAVRKVCVRLARRVEGIVHEGDLPVVVGGDHTCAIGTWKGVAHALQDKGRVGLLWIDAHMDAHTPPDERQPAWTRHAHQQHSNTAMQKAHRHHGGGVGRSELRASSASEASAGEAELLEGLGVRVFPHVQSRGARRRSDAG